MSDSTEIIQQITDPQLHELLGDYIAPAGELARWVFAARSILRVRRLRAFATTLDGTIQTLEHRIRDLEAFGFLLEKTLPIAADEHREFKRNMLANILTDAANDGDADVSLYRLFIEIVDAIEPHHVKLLRRIRKRSDEVDQIFGSDPYRYQGQAGAEFDQLVPLIEVEGGDTDDGATQRALTVHVLSSLVNHGLVSTRAKGGSRNAGREVVTSILNASTIWYMSSYILTPVGKRFCEYLEGEDDERTDDVDG